MKNTKIIKFLKILKRRFVGFVAALLAMTITLPYMGSSIVDEGIVYADKELQSETLPFRLPQYSDDPSASDTTMYYWHNNYTVAFRGKTNASDYMTSATQGGFQTIFNDGTGLPWGYNFYGKLKDDVLDISSSGDSGGGSPITFGASEDESNGFVSYCDVDSDNNLITKYATTGGTVAESDAKIEMKITLKPSNDKKYILLDLYAFNRLATTKYLSLRMSADTYVAHDYSRVIINSQDNIIHCVDDNNGNSTSFYSFDVVCRDNNIVLNPFNVAWAGKYDRRNSKGNAWAFRNDTGTDTDSGMSLGWRDIKLLPYQLVHRRVALLARTTTFYVNPIEGYDPHPVEISSWNNNHAEYEKFFGAFDKPFKTIQCAMDYATSRSINRYYICIQGNTELPDISLNNQNKDIVFQSSDLTFDGRRNNTVYSLLTKNKKIDISAGKVTFQDIIVDGEFNNRTTPFINLTNGRAQFSSGSVFKNIKNEVGAAVINVEGDNSSLLLYGTEIDNCVSSAADKKNCAISYSGGNAKFLMNGVNRIYNNVNSVGTPSNVYLADDRVIQVTNILRHEANSSIVSKVSIKTGKMPEPYISSIEDDDEEVIIAKPTDTYPEIDWISNCPFEQYFLSDEGDNVNRIKIDEGRFTGNEKNVVLKQPGNTISFNFVNDKGITYQSSVLSRADETYPIGKSIVIATPSNLPKGYIIDRIDISGNGLTANNNKDSADFGKVTGKMLEGDVIITYVVIPKPTKIKFTTNGGAPEEIEDIVGNVGNSVSGILPMLTKYAYVLKGWFTDNNNPIGFTDFTTNRISNLPATFPEEETTYYAKWAPDSNVQIPIIEIHTNEDASITFFETSESDAAYRAVETPLTTFNFTSKNIPGYIPRADLSAVNPERFAYRTDELQVGNFIESAGVVRLAEASPTTGGYLPSTRTTVNFKYEVDETVKNPIKLTLVRKAADGTYSALNVNGATELTQGEYYAEQNLNIDPPQKDGYIVVGAEIIEGDEPNPEQFYSGVTGNFESGNSYRFIGKMPNQPVTIKYIYELTAGRNEFIVNKVDDDVLDSSFEIISSSVDVKGADEPITANKTEHYGYVYYDKSVTPNVGSFDASDSYTGTMPLAESVTVEYKYHRDPNYFKPITFKPSKLLNCTNTLVATGSPDLAASGDNFIASVLTNIGGAGWKFSELVNRNIVPEINIENPDNFELNTDNPTGFFIDANDNGIFDDGVDTRVTEDTQFSGYTIVVPDINRIIHYVNISFTTDGNGMLSGETIAQYEDGTKWGDIVKPTTSGYYFISKGWFLDDVLVTDDDYVLQDGDIFVAKFDKDTSLQDRVKKVLYSVSIGEDGNGIITMRDLHRGYTYIVVDAEGNIVSSKDNTDSTKLSFTHEDGIEINTTYILYEVKGISDMDSMHTIDDIDAYVGSDTSGASDVSDETECYVPAVIRNYHVSVDTDLLTTDTKNVASLTLSPTSSDYEYALYKDGALVEGCDFRAGSTDGISFTDLMPGTSYSVVTRRNGVETVNTGTVIYIDAIDELTDDTYALTVINGTINGENVAMVTAGERVTVETLDPSFARWQVLYGNVTLSSFTNKRTSFDMPKQNVLIVAKEAESIASLKLTQENFGIDDYAVNMDNSKELDIIDSLAGNVEKYLSNNRFKLQYKVTFNKDILTFEEEEEVKDDLGDAGRGVLAIDVDVDRFVDNNRVDVFEEILPIPEENLPGSGVLEVLNNMYGSDVIDKIEGLTEYLTEMDTDISDNDSIVSTESEIDDATTLDEDVVTTDSEIDIDIDVSSESDVEIETESESETEEDIETDIYMETESSSDELDYVVVYTDSEIFTDEVDNTYTSEIAPDNDTAADDNQLSLSEEPEVDSDAVDDTKDYVPEDAEGELDQTSVSNFDDVTETESKYETEAEEITLDNEVSSFNGTLHVKTKSELKELVDNLVLFGSTFSNDITVNTYVMLPKIDQNNGDYKVYKVNGDALSPVPFIIDDNAAKEKGMISFVADMESRYIIAYNKYNTVTFINDSIGASEVTGTAEKTILKVKYGDLASDYDDEIGATPPAYEYEKATFDNPVWSYKADDNLDEYVYNPTVDAVIAPMTVYALYDSNYDFVMSLLKKIEDALKRAKIVLDNYFLLNEEHDSIKTLYDKLVSYVENNTMSNEEAMSIVDELLEILDVVEPKLETREVNYVKHTDKTTDVNTATKSGRSGGSSSSSGGSGGGGGGVNTKISAVGGPGAFNSTSQNVTPVVPNVSGNLSQVVSSNGSTLTSVDSNLSIFLKADGSLSTNEWVLTNNGWYHTSDVGAVDIGWRLIGPKWYYFDQSLNANDRGKMHVGWLQDGSSLYFTSNDGDMIIGYQNINGATYYFNNDRNHPYLPVGALITNAATPDGRYASADGIVR